MHKLIFNPTALLLLCCLLLTNELWSKAARYRCSWRTDPATSMVIGWDQVTGYTPVIYYDIVDHGTNVNNYAYQQEPDYAVHSKGMNNHFARLQYLRPNTIYYFVIEDSEGVNERYSFKTAPDNPEEPLAIIAGGDSRNHRTARVFANKIVSKLRPHFVLFGGDMTGKDSGREWIDWMNDWQETISVEKARRITPIIVARGNHEYSNKTLIELFDVAEETIYYSLEFGGGLLRIYTLNSLMASGGEQKEWLAWDLENHDATWKMAQYHFATRPHTKRKAERNDQLANWSRLFYKYGVDLVVESDIHTVKSTYPISPSTASGSDQGFIRDDERGTVYVGEGCWGAPLRRNDDIKSWTRDSGSFNQFKWILVDQYKIEVRTVKTDNGDQVGTLPSENLFYAPPGLDIWEPSNGAVVTINAKYPEQQISYNNEEVLASRQGSSTSVSNPVISTPTVAPKLEILNFGATTTSPNIMISWSTENEPAGIAFQIQRSYDGKHYEVIEHLAGLAPNKGTTYLITDKSSFSYLENGVSYRLKRILSNGKEKIYAPCMVGADLNNWQYYPEINVDYTSGRLSVPYMIPQTSNVSVRLLTTELREINNSITKNQKAGQHSKMIDMKKMRSGNYLVIVKAGNKIIEKYRVYK